ncbi:protein HASTY 1 [Corchorus olitorius]|uniref:Protein HASTY 1 n=1 Tax=Corchorus olitorius TaxID=93759 RepID=A0A1R3G0R9_9ROSI|nr:protein HASTY 1 [Corchorus olitorius]
MQSLKILILNAGGVQHPDFLRIFSQLYNEHRPQEALVTETRLALAQVRHQRLSLDFPEPSILDPIGYFWRALAMELAHFDLPANVSNLCVIINTT